MRTRVPFIGPSYEFSALPMSVQESVNYYLEVGGDESREPLALRGTPGLTAFVEGLDGPLRALCYFDGVGYCVAGGKFYSFDENGVEAEIGDLPGLDRVFMHRNETQLVIADRQAGYLKGHSIFPGSTSFAYVYNFSTAVFGAVTDTDFSASGDRTFFISDLDDATSYDALNYAPARSNPDKVLSILTDHDQVVLVGQETGEFFYYTGDSDFPFAQQAGAIIEIGTSAAGSVTRGDNSFFWLGDDRVVYMNNGYNPLQISPDPINEAIALMERVDDAFGFYHVWKGHKFYTLTFPSARKSFVFDSGFLQNPRMGWHARESYTLGRWRANNYCYGFNKHLVGDFQTGTIWEMGSDVYAEGSDPLIASRVGGYLHADQKAFRVPTFELLMDTGRGVATGQGSDPQIMLQITKDGGRTYGPERWRGMGEMGDFERRVIWRNNGVARASAAFKVSVSDPVPRDIVGCVGDIEVGN